MSFGLSRGKPQEYDGYGLEMADLPALELGRIDPRDWFANPSNRFEIEIGSGKGTFLLQHARAAPEANLLGIEAAGEFFRYAADRLRRHAISNAKILHGDAVEFLRFWCADEVAAVIHLYFSDPWPKKRHHKRRVVQDASMREFARVLQPGGALRLVTDHDELWAWCEEHAARHADLFVRRPFETPVSAGENEIVGTNYERKFAREGRAFHAMTLMRRPSPSMLDGTS